VASEHGRGTEYLIQEDGTGANKQGGGTMGTQKKAGEETRHELMS